MLALVLAAQLTVDGDAQAFLRICDRPKPTTECGAYLTGFVDSAMAHEWMSTKGIPVSMPKKGMAASSMTLCLPNPVQIESVRKATVAAVKERKPGAPLHLTVLVALANLYPCK